MRFTQNTYPCIPYLETTCPYIQHEEHTCPGIQFKENTCCGIRSIEGISTGIPCVENLVLMLGTCHDIRYIKNTIHVTRSKRITCSASRYADHLVGLVVKASPSRAEDPGFDSRLRRWDFFPGSHTSDLRIGTVATLPDAWRLDWSNRCQYTVT